MLIIPTLFGIMVINFAVIQTAPGGPVEQIIHLYSFNDLEEWRYRYDSIYSKDELLKYFHMVRPLIQSQENTFLLPAPIKSIYSLFNKDN